MKKRIESIDLFRGLGIITMIIGHINFGGELDKFIDRFIHAFHMPMFFFISGFFYERGKDFRIVSLICKRAKSLLVPYFTFGLLSYFIWLIFYWNTKSFTPLINLFFINTDGLAISGALWFLTSLFFTEVIYHIITKFIHHTILKTGVIVLIAVLGNIEAIILPVKLPWGLGAACVGVGLFHIGYLVKNNMDKKEINFILNMPFSVWIIGTIITVILIFMNGYVNMRHGTYAYIPLFWINAVSSIFIGLNYSKYLNSMKNREFFFGWIKKMGKDSISFLCLNQLIIAVLNRLVSYVFFIGIMKGIIVLIGTILILFVCNYIIQKTSLSVFIGKKVIAKQVHNLDLKQR